MVLKRLMQEPAMPGKGRERRGLGMVKFFCHFYNLTFTVEIAAVFVCNIVVASAAAVAVCRGQLNGFFLPLLFQVLLLLYCCRCCCCHLILTEVLVVRLLVPLDVEQRVSVPKLLLPFVAKGDA